MSTPSCTTDASKLALLNEYRKAFWSEGRDPHVLVTLGQSYQAIGCLDEAIRLFQEAAKIDPKLALAHVHLASAYEESGQIEDAIFSYVEASLVDAEDPYDAANRVYEILSDFPEKPEALAMLRKICSRYPGYEYLQEVLAEFCHRYGEYSEAEAVYRKMLTKEGLDSERRLDWEWRLSGVLISSGKYDEAFPLIERVLPQLGTKYNVESIERFLADNYLKAGRFESALKIYLHRAAEFLPGESSANMLRKAARCYEGLREHEKAVDCLIEILTFIRETGSADDDWIQKKTVISDPRFYEDIYAALARNYEAKGDLVRAREAFRKEKEYYTKALSNPHTSSPSSAV